MALHSPRDDSPTPLVRPQKVQNNLFPPIPRCLNWVLRTGMDTETRNDCRAELRYLMVHAKALHRARLDATDRTLRLYALHAKALHRAR
jgi:hypothetical protein